MSANALLLEAHARDGRTVVGRIRTGGLCRASRPFHEGDAARIVVSQLGPGMVRGDAFHAGGRVAAGAHLIVAGQMATRVLSGPDEVVSEAEWTVDPGATLELLPQPTLVCTGASYRSHTRLHLAANARAVVVELVRREPGAALRVTTVAQRGSRRALHDSLRFEPDDDDHGAIGTLAIFGAAIGVDPRGSAISLDALDRVADRCTGVRIGTGTLRDGDLLARVTGPDVWAVNEALAALRAAIPMSP